MKSIFVRVVLVMAGLGLMAGVKSEALPPSTCLAMFDDEAEYCLTLDSDREFYYCLDLAYGLTSGQSHDISACELHGLMVHT